MHCPRLCARSLVSISDEIWAMMVILHCYKPPAQATEGRAEIVLFQHVFRSSTMPSRWLPRSCQQWKPLSMPRPLKSYPPLPSRRFLHPPSSMSQHAATNILVNDADTTIEASPSPLPRRTCRFIRMRQTNAPASTTRSFLVFNDSPIPLADRTTHAEWKHTFPPQAFLHSSFQTPTTHRPFATHRYAYHNQKGIRRPRC